MTVFRKFEVCASYESSVVKSPPSPSRETLPASLTEQADNLVYNTFLLRLYRDYEIKN